MFTVETKDGSEHAEFYSKEAAFDFMKRIGKKFDVTLKIKRDDKENTHIESRYKGTDFRLVDTYGDALTIDVYTMKSTGERRIQLSLDNEDSTFRNMIEEHDIAVDINFDTVLLLMDILEGVNEMELTTAEKKVIEHMRKGAVIRITYHDADDIETAKTIVHEYCGRQPEPRSHNGSQWVTSRERLEEEDLPELTVFLK